MLSIERLSVICSYMRSNNAMRKYNRQTQGTGAAIIQRGSRFALEEAVEFVAYRTGRCSSRRSFPPIELA